MITEGQWQLAADEGIPEQPAYIYVVIGDQEVMIAEIMAPTLWQNIEGEPSEVPCGDPEDNAKLMTFSPVLLRFVQFLARGQGVGGYSMSETAKRATAMLKQLAEVEVTDESNRR